MESREPLIIASSAASGSFNQRFPRVWDAHVHNWNAFADLAFFTRHLERHGIERVNLLGPLLGGFQPTPQEVEASNDRTEAFHRALPERVVPYCYVNPCHEAHSVAEWKRCRALGFAGLKLWVAARCHEACNFPVIEAVMADGAPVLVHTWSKAGGNLPTESTPADMAELAARYPSGKFIMAHTGGRYERGIAAICDLSNVTVDYSGSANEAGAYELAVRELGPDRVIFGTDGPSDFLASIGRVREAIACPEVRHKVLYQNIANLTLSSS